MKPEPLNLEKVKKEIKDKLKDNLLPKMNQANMAL